MIYTFIKRLVTISLYIFFKKIVYTGKENIPKEGPLIIVANHPNTFTDPLIIALAVKQRVGFIANASIFTNKTLAKIFTYLHIIPIYRKKDIAKGEKPDNQKTFAKCNEYLSNKGTFLIFPEGSSYYELKLREIKTGTARIALSFEESKNFNGNLKITPISLDYSDALQFRSMVSVIISKPITLDKYRETYLKDEFEAAKELTQEIKEELAENVTHTSGKVQESLLLRVHKFVYTYQVPDANIYKNPRQSLDMRKQLSVAFSYTKEKHTELYRTIEKKIHFFFNSLNVDGLTPGFFTDKFTHQNKPLILFGHFIQFFLLLPFFLFGVVTNFLPFIIPTKIFRSLKTDIEYKTSVEMILNIFTFPLFYTTATLIFRYYFGKALYLTILFVILLFASGYIAYYFWIELKRFKRMLQFYFFTTNKKRIDYLILKKDILKDIELAEENYFKENKPNN